MPTPVNSVLVVIASPGDAVDERATVRDALTDWSVTTGLRQGVLALPWLYERHAVASMGARAQSLINAQAVDRADVVVAFFDARLGSNTGIDVSGTAEEIRRAIELGKPVHVYFSTEPIARDADFAQLTALKDFRQSLEAEGLLGEYQDPGDLAGQITRALQADIDHRGWGEGLASTTRAGAQLTWQHVHVTEPTGTDKNGKINSTTRRNDLVVSNASDVDAEGLTFTVNAVNDARGDDYYHHFEAPTEPVTVYGRSERQWTLIPGQSMTLQIDAQWTEKGLPRARTWTITAA